MKLYEMSEEQLDKYWLYCLQKENLQAASEVSDFIKFYNKNVEVIKGRKVPKGTKGKVFFLRRQHYGTGQFGYVTIIGILDGNEQKHYTNVDNVKII